jgi:hypothetical protein
VRDSARRREDEDADDEDCSSHGTVCVVFHAGSKDPAST